MKNTNIIFFIALLSLLACNSGGEQSDAFGNFEADEILVSAESNGKLIILNVEEGKEVKQGQLLAIIDTTQLYLKKQQLILSVAAIKAKMVKVKPQVDVLLEQKQNLNRELDRLSKLRTEGAATQKQLDDLQGEMLVVDSKILATKTQLNTQNSGLYSEIAPLEVQIQQINDQLTKSYIRSPLNGTVLATYLNQGELAAMGRPVLKLADLSSLDLRAYVSGGQLGQFKIGEEVTVLVDDGENGLKPYQGRVSWVSSKAEFTPKIVQTKEERVNLVYACKVKVPNDGSLKIGMPGEVRIQGVTLAENE